MRFSLLHPSTVCAGLLLLSLPMPLHAQDASSVLPVQDVTLYTSGVGYFERGGAVDGDATQTLLFPVGQVNDVLKSLVLLDTGGGSIQPVTYAAQDPVGRQLQAFSLDLSDNPDRATLFNRLRGAAVTVTTTDSPPKTDAGTIIGVESQTITLPNNGGTTQASVLNLLTDTGLKAIPLSNISDLQLSDPALNNELRQALHVVAEGRDTAKRPVTLAFSGKGKRNVRIGYLTETPLWQTTYRLVLGTHPQVQGWALVQNTGQDDWTNIHLSLVSGRPISFIQDLYTPLYVPRPVVAPRVAAAPTPQTYGSDMMASRDVPQVEAKADASSSNGNQLGGGGFGGGGFPGGGGGRGGFAGNAPAATMAPAPIAEDGIVAHRAVPIMASVGSSGAQLGSALFRYDIKIPVTVPRQQSAMIPFVAAPISAEPVAIYNASVQADHPLTGARLKNTTGLHLMGGPLTVFDDTGSGTGYVGDALMDDTEPGQTRLLSYAVEQSIDASSKPGDSNGHLVAVTISQGVLVASHKEQQSTVYTFKNNGAKDRTVVIEHPDPGNDWKLLEPEKPVEKTDSLYRFDLPVPTGASKSLTVRQQRTVSESYGLVDADLGTIVAYSQQGEASDAVKNALQEVIRRRRSLAETQAKITNIDAQTKSVSDGQARIRDNMKALDRASALYKRYVSELDAQETKLNSLAAQRSALQNELAQRQADLNSYVANLTLS